MYVSSSEVQVCKWRCSACTALQPSAGTSKTASCRAHVPVQPSYGPVTGFQTTSSLPSRASHCTCKRQQHHPDHIHPQQRCNKMPGAPMRDPRQAAPYFRKNVPAAAAAAGSCQQCVCVQALTRFSAPLTTLMYSILSPTYTAQHSTWHDTGSAWHAQHC
jgi:hypothetical protein